MTEVNMKAVLERAVYILEEEGYSASVYENYSGRGMYGNTTDGITTGASGPQVGAAITQAYVEIALDLENSREPVCGYDLCEVLNDARDAVLKRTDSLGRDTIYY